MKDNRGITLIELIMVISILSMVLLIPISKGNIILNSKEKKELKEFKNDLNYARNKAVVESIRYSIMLKPKDNCYIIYKHTPYKHEIERKKFTSGIKIDTTNIDFHEVVFNYSGAPEKAGTIYLKDKKGNKIEITVTPATGKINIKYP